MHRTQHRINQKPRYLLVFIVGLITAFFMFLPFLIYDKGYFLYCGDYNSQQIPFTVFSSDWLYNGMDSYSFGIDLGSSFINSFSYYTLGSPFAMAIMLFPSSLAPYLMSAMLCIKFATAALLGYVYVRRYFSVDGYAMCAAILYAFSGYAIYNVFFNNFVDIVALFPLLLYALDEYFYEDRKGLFAAAVAINFFNNYFFFTGQVVFLVIYFVAKLIAGEYRLTLRKFIFIAIETIIGVMMGAVLAIPAFISILDNPRSINQDFGFSLLLHTSSQQYAAILSSMFLPPDPPYLPNIFTDGVIKWTSMSAYLPVFSIAGVLTFFKATRRNSVKIVLAVCLVMALVPVLNSAFYALNANFYARWYYMPLLLMALATAKSLERYPTAFKRNILIVGIITLCYSVFGLVPEMVEEELTLGVVKTGPILWLTIGTTIFGLALGFCWIKFFRSSKFSLGFLMAFVCIFSALYGIIHLATGKIPQLENDSYYKAESYDMMDSAILSDDSDFFRVDTYNAYDNVASFWGLNGIQYFHSVVSPSILEFYPPLGVKRDVSSKPTWENYALRSLLSVKYLLVPNRENDTFKEDEELFGFVFHETIEEYTVYENELFLPMGLVFDKYITQENFDSTTESLRSNLLLRGILLDEEQINTHSDVMTPLDPLLLTNLSYPTMIDDVNNMHTAEFFIDTGDGFVADISLESEAMVLFTVPYDRGFTAFIDDKEVEIEQVNNGLMAVVVPAGDHKITFSYETPFLNLSILICIIGIFLFIAYILFDRIGQRGHDRTLLNDLKN